MRILERNLDDDQLAIAREVERSILVLAPPGSGKTRLLINAAAHRIRSDPDAMFRACCLTFSVEAARELRTRLAEPTLEAPTNRLWIGNFHQLAASLLSRWGHLIGWPRDAGLLVPPENIELIRDILSGLDIRGVNPRNVASALGSVKGRRRVRENLQPGTLEQIRTAYQGRLAELNLRDFDDLILDAVKLLQQHEKARQILRDTYRFVFVDELQDTNQLQLDFIGQLVGDETVVFGVADDDQMIYAWRDARPENVREFQERFDAELRVLTGNYRCPPRVVEVANAVISLNSRHRADLMQSLRTDIEGEVVLADADGENAEAELAAAYVREELESGTAPSELVVLAPTRFLFDLLRPALTGKSVPYVAIGFDDLLGAPAIRLVRGCLSEIGGGRLLEQEVRAAHELNGDDWIDEDRARSTIEIARDIPPRSLPDMLLSSLGLGSASKPTRDGDALRICVRMLRRAIHEHEPLGTPELCRAVLLEWNRLEAAALRAEGAVKLMTCYGAKGTEYEVVVLPFLNDGKVPYAPRGQDIDWEDSRRLFYVSLTRAKRRVILTRNSQRPDSPLLEVLSGLDSVTIASREQTR